MVTSPRPNNSAQRDLVIPYRPRPWQQAMHQGLASHRWGCVVAHRRAGKTVALVVHLVLSAMACTRRRPVFGYVAPFYKQAKQLAWEYLKQYTAVVPGRRINESELWVELPHNGARLRVYGCDNPDALRGVYFDGIVLDEYADMHPEAWETVIRPALSDRQGWACLCGTPRGHNAFFNVYREALQSSAWFTGLYRADQTGSIAPAELAALKADMSEPRFRQEYLCDFDVSSSDAFISLCTVLEAVGRPGLRENYQPVVVGVDVARFGDDASVIWARQGRDAKSIPYEMHQGLDTMQLAGRVMEYATHWNAHTVFVDGGGVGGGVVDRLHQLGLDAIEVNFGGRSDNPVCLNKRADMWFSLREWLRVGAIPDVPRLVADLTAVTYSFDAANLLRLDPKEELKKRGLPSPDLGDALALTFAWPVHPVACAQTFAAGSYSLGNSGSYGIGYKMPGLDVPSDGYPAPFDYIPHPNGSYDPLRSQAYDPFA